VKEIVEIRVKEEEEEEKFPAVEFRVPTD